MEERELFLDVGVLERIVITGKMVNGKQRSATKKNKIDTGEVGKYDSD